MHEKRSSYINDIAKEYGREGTNANKERFLSLDKIEEDND